MADGEYPNGGDFKKTLQIVSQPNHIRPIRKSAGCCLKGSGHKPVSQRYPHHTCAHGMPFSSPFSPKPNQTIDRYHVMKNVPPRSIRLSLSIIVNMASLDSVASCLTQRIMRGQLQEYSLAGLLATWESAGLGSWKTYGPIDFTLSEYFCRCFFS